MQLDIALLIILAVFAILGFKNGFVHTLFYTFGWLIALVVAFFLRDKVKEFLTDSTDMYKHYHERVYDICLNFTSGYTDTLTGGNTGDFSGIAAGDLTGSALDAAGDLTGGALDAAGNLTGGALDAAGNLTGGALGAAGDVTRSALGDPDGSAINSVLETVGGAAGAFGEKMTLAAADQLASASFVVLCFIGTVIVVKFILLLLTLAFSRKHRRGFVGALDATGGAFLGIFQGFIVVFVIMLLILPVSLAINPWLFEKISGMLDSSFFAKTWFTTNPLIPLIEKVAPGLFDPYEWISQIGNK
jgi:uncharacterized membrane protein required for colicin V production